MPLKIEHGDIFASRAQVLVNPVNRVGVMGAGLAKEFRFRYPSMFQLYKASCAKGDIANSTVFLCPISVGDAPMGPNEFILCFPTKNDWRNPSHLHLIATGLAQTTELAASMGLSSFAFPALGCGLGGLSWENQVLPLMRKYLDNAPFESTVYLRGAE